jgi:hypothetical protein
VTLACLELNALEGDYNMTMPNPAITILTGAGFSLPYLEYDGHQLSTAFLTQLLCDESLMRNEFKRLYGYEAEDGFKKICSVASDLNLTLQKSLRKAVPVIEPNFEMIIYILETLVNINPTNRSAVDRLEGNLGMPLLLGTVLQPRPKFKGHDISLDDLYDYQEFMLDVVAGFKCSQDGLQELGQFFHTLLRDYDVKYYTLNYDRLFADVLAWINKNIGDVEFNKRFNTGTLYGDDGLITGAEMFRSERWAQERRHSLFCLHGSVCYRDSPTTKSIDFNPRQPVSPKQRRLQRAFGLKRPIHHVMGDGAFRFDKSFISGFNKSVKLTSEPYAGIFAKFREDLFTSRELLVMGYAYNDDHVNAVFAAQPPHLKKTTIVDYIADSDYPTMKDQLLQKINQRLTTTRPNGHNGLPTESWNIDLPQCKITRGRASHLDISDPKYDEWENDYNGTRTFIQRWTKHGIPPLGGYELKLITDPR